MPEREVLDLRRKVGFLELCMMHDVPVVPSYTFNEVDHLSQVSYWTVEKRYPLAFRARVHFQYLFGIILPFMKNIFPVRATGVKEGHVTVIGRPIRLPYTKEPPTKAQLEHSMEIYIAALQELYDTHAPLYSSRERELVIT